MPAQPRVVAGRRIHVRIEDAHGKPDDAGEWEAFCPGTVEGRWWAIRRSPYREIEVYAVTERDGSLHWKIA